MLSRLSWICWLPTLALEELPGGLGRAFQSKGNPPVAMEAIENGELWLWHVSVGNPGSMNEINIVDASQTMGRILSGQFPPRIDYVINKKSRNLPYCLADGIYPSWPI